MLIANPIMSLLVTKRRPPMETKTHGREGHGVAMYTTYAKRKSVGIIDAKNLLPKTKSDFQSAALPGPPDDLV